MAEIRNSLTPIPQPSQPARPMSPARAAALQAAQKAFFNAALGSPETPRQAEPTATAAANTENAAPRIPRPGSLLDIKV